VVDRSPCVERHQDDLCQLQQPQLILEYLKALVLVLRWVAVLLAPQVR
jgi:hypothetical protein